MKILTKIDDLGEFENKFKNFDATGTKTNCTAKCIQE